MRKIRKLTFSLKGLNLAVITSKTEMEMFLPGCNESALKSEAARDQGQRQFNPVT